MEHRLFKGEENIVEEKEGSRITQLAIFPYDKKSLERDFLWRLSKMTIETEEWEVEPFLGYDRTLTVAEGEVVLAHEGERVARLKEEEQDTFDGGKKTKSFGKMTGYDLLVQKGSHGILEWTHVETNSKKLVPADCSQFQRRIWCLYCSEGYCVVQAGDESILLREGEQLVMDFGEEDAAGVSVMGEGTLIWSQIFLDAGEVAEEIPREKGTFGDFLGCVKLANSNFRGSKYIFKSLRGVWFDEDLQKGIRRIERFYLPFLVGLLGLAITGFAALEIGGKSTVVPAILIWLAVDLIIISPLMYFFSVPKPLHAHIKEIDKLTPYEQKVYERQKTENPRLERLLKKYTITGRNKYID